MKKSKFNPELLQIFNTLILEKFGLDLKFDEKKMENYLDILDDHLTEDTEDTESEFECGEADDLDDIIEESNECEYKRR